MRVEAGPVQAEVTANAAEAALRLILDVPVAAVSNFKNAAAALSAIPNFPLRWIAFVPDRMPSSPPPGPGLMVSKDAESLADEASELVRGHGPAALLELPLDELPRLFQTPAERIRAVELALGHPSGEAPFRVNWEGAAWLARSPSGRPAALAGLAHDAIDGWLASGLAREEDLSVLSGRLGAAHAPAVRQLLAGRANAPAEYRRHFPDDSEGLAALLGDAERLTWERLADDAAPVPARQAVEKLVEALGRAPEDVMTLDQLTRASLATSAAHPAFLAALARAGLPASMGSGLLRGAPERAEGAPPRLHPEAAWMRPFSAQKWLACGDRFSANAGWRAWWLAGVEALLGCGRLSKEDVFQAGMAMKSAAVLELGGAPESLAEFLWTDRPVALPPRDGDWPEAADSALAEALRARTLFERLAQPLDAGVIGWLAGRGHGREEFAAMARLGEALARGAPANSRMLAAVAHYFPRKLLLGQIAAWGAAGGGPERDGALNALIDARWLTRDEAAWLRTLLMRWDLPPPMPRWPVEDLIELLPVLDPVRDVVRSVLNRAVREEGEVELLGRLMERLTAVALPAPPGSFPEAAHRVRPDWVSALGSLPGWEEAAGAAAAVGALRERARQVQARYGSELPDQDRAAIAPLATRDLR